MISQSVSLVSQSVIQPVSQPIAWSVIQSVNLAHGQSVTQTATYYMFGQSVSHEPVT